MADLSITAVRPTTTTRIEIVTYGATVAVGNALYLDTADNEWKLADANGGSTLIAGGSGIAIALTPGVDGGQGVVAKRGGPVVLVGPTLTVAQQYVVSATAGGIAPRGDLTTTGDYITEVGVASSTSQLELDLNATGIQVP